MREMHMSIFNRSLITLIKKKEEERKMIGLDAKKTFSMLMLLFLFLIGKITTSKKFLFDFY